jgi:hypothetical protein
MTTAQPVTGLKDNACGSHAYNARRMLNLRHFKALSALLCALSCTLGVARAESPPAGGFMPVVAVAPLPVASRVVVHKSARKLELMRGDEVLRSYRISLGLMPEGHKERAGDFRTPEGRYYLTRRNARSDYFLAVQVSYPNSLDVRNAKANGWDPGGAIMVHGQPNKPKRGADAYVRDWTDGCIALSNSDMVEFWLLTQNNTPIDILP